MGSCFSADANSRGVIGGVHRQAGDTTHDFVRGQRDGEPSFTYFSNANKKRLAGAVALNFKFSVLVKSSTRRNFKKNRHCKSK
jgi:hypothetical protein